ncbi:MAG: hypothetical protein AAGN82_16935 [Myxococcota bacterium]
MWRPDDAALLGRIEAELVFAALWRHEAGEAAPPHPRAAGLVSLLRSHPGGEARVARLVGARLERPHEAPAATDDLVGWVRNLRAADTPPRLAHHLALFYRRVAMATEGATARAAWRRSLAAWFAMTEEGAYLRRVGPAEAEAWSDDDVDARRSLAARQPLDELGRRAREGAAATTVEAAAALRALDGVAVAVAEAGLPVARGRALVAHASRLRAAAVEEALAPVAQHVADMVIRDAVAREGPAAMARVATIWHWSQRDEHVERFAVDEVTPLAWRIYQRASGFGALPELLAPIVPLVEALARRVEADPTAVAYAAPVAQMFVFRSEMARPLARRIELAERAVTLCPSHRNGRFVLASLLCRDVKRQLDGGFWRVVDRAAMEATLDRAATLNPNARALDALRKRLASRPRLRLW